MSFYVSLSGLKAAAADLSTISNNVANVNSTAFKKSRAVFNDLFAAAPMQTTSTVAGQGVRLAGVTQQFTQGTIESTDKVLDLAITGEGFFTVRSQNADGTTGDITYTRNGAFAVDQDRYVVDQTGSRLQVFPVDPSTGVIQGAMDTANLVPLQIPLTNPNDPTAQLTSVGVSKTGIISAVYSNDETINLGVTAMATFPNIEGLRQQGDAHWQVTRESGDTTFGTANSGLFGTINSGALERANVDITEELVALIAAQRNFQANAKAIETGKAMTDSVINIR